MAVISTGTHPKLLWPGIRAIFGNAYDERPLEYPDIFDKVISDKAYEEAQEITTFPLAPIKPQGEAVSYVSDSQGYTSRLTNVTYALGFIVTQEENDDNLYEQVGSRRAKAIAFSLRSTKETVGANILNRGWTSGYNGGDSVVLFSASHPTRNGNASNTLSVDADISEAAIEDMIVQIMGMTNNVGLLVQFLPQKLIVPRQLWFEANRILKSVLQNDTANNAVNVLKATNALPGGIVMNHYLTDTDAWFIKTDCKEGLVYQERRAMQGLEQDNDFDTLNKKAKAWERYVFGWNDWRAVVGSAGA